MSSGIGGLPSFRRCPVFRHSSIISPVFASRTSMRSLFILTGSSGSCVLCGLRAQARRARRAPGRSPRLSGMLLECGAARAFCPDSARAGGACVG